MEVKAGEVLRSKTMRLVEQPTLEELLEQLKVTNKMYAQVCQYDSGLHLCVGRKRDAGNNVRQHFGDNARVVDGSEVLETLQLVQIDRQTALDGLVTRDGDERLRQLLAAADSMTRKTPITSSSHDLGSNQNEPPLAAVPSARS
ncbi:hypothetical protein ON010_g10855 [Phytophthora cinnamomi]|nr:hypothetical protein ON010_g10855 [Phytophthora cinnamomi]